jgi:hypothetical protein
MAYSAVPDPGDLYKSGLLDRALQISRMLNRDKQVASIDAHGWNLGLALVQPFEANPCQLWLPKPAKWCFGGFALH